MPVTVIQTALGDGAAQGHLTRLTAPAILAEAQGLVLIQAFAVRRACAEAFLARDSSPPHLAPASPSFRPACTHAVTGAIARARERRRPEPAIYA